VVTVDGARLFFPEERPMDLVPHLEQHWAAVAAARALAPDVPSSFVLARFDYALRVSSLFDCMF
jgi:hypothetical protein